MFIHNVYMAVTDAPFFSMLKSRMSFLNDRQKILADNVANVSTPKYVPKDLDEKSFKDTLSRIIPTNSGGLAGPAPLTPISMIATQSGHMSGGVQITNSQAVKAPDSETTLDGNKVVLEEQMIKVADTRMNYDIALGLYQKGLQLMRMAAKKIN